MKNWSSINFSTDIYLLYFATTLKHLESIIKIVTAKVYLKESIDISIDSEVPDSKFTWKKVV